MHIAICDDEEVFLHAAEALIKQDVTAKHEVSFFVLVRNWQRFIRRAGQILIYSFWISR